MNWTWKVYVRPDGTADFLPTDAATHFEVIREGLPLRDAMALSDEINSATPATEAAS